MTPEQFKSYLELTDIAASEAMVAYHKYMDKFAGRKDKPKHPRMLFVRIEDSMLIYEGEEGWGGNNETIYFSLPMECLLDPRKAEELAQRKIDEDDEYAARKAEDALARKQRSEVETLRILKAKYPDEV